MTRTTDKAIKRTRGTYRIHRPGLPEEGHDVEGTIYGPLAVRNEYGSYRIDHVPTGLLLGDHAYPRYAQAVAIVKSLLALPVDWSAIQSQADYGALPAEIRKQIQAACRG